MVQFVLLNFFLQLLYHEEISLFIREFFGSHDDGWVVFDKILARLKQKQRVVLAGMVDHRYYVLHLLAPSLVHYLLV